MGRETGSWGKGQTKNTLYENVLNKVKEKMQQFLKKEVEQF